MTISPKYDRANGLGIFARKLIGNNFKRKRFLREAKQMAAVQGLTFEEFVATPDAVRDFWSGGGMLHTSEQYREIQERRK